MIKASKIGSMQTMFMVEDISEYAERLIRSSGEVDKIMCMVLASSKKSRHATKKNVRIAVTGNCVYTKSHVFNFGKKRRMNYKERAEVRHYRHKMQDYEDAEDTKQTFYSNPKFTFKNSHYQQNKLKKPTLPCLCAKRKQCSKAVLV
uniref:Uncharacterized protein n=1 Tax=Ditylenchus dipsaci TaxID=166011 RepID=A0A915D551_9BILA